MVAEVAPSRGHLADVAAAQLHGGPQDLQRAEPLVGRLRGGEAEVHTVPQRPESLRTLPVDPLKRGAAQDSAREPHIRLGDKHASNISHIVNTISFSAKKSSTRR